jgi:hypothetical protein
LVAETSPEAIVRTKERSVNLKLRFISLPTLALAFAAAGAAGNPLEIAGRLFVE